MRYFKIIMYIISLILLFEVGMAIIQARSGFSKIGLDDLQNMMAANMIVVLSLIVTEIMGIYLKDNSNE